MQRWVSRFRGERASNGICGVTVFLPEIEPKTNESRASVEVGMELEGRGHGVLFHLRKGGNLVTWQHGWAWKTMLNKLCLKRQVLHDLTSTWKLKMSNSQERLVKIHKRQLEKKKAYELCQSWDPNLPGQAVFPWECPVCPRLPCLTKCTLRLTERREKVAKSISDCRFTVEKVGQGRILWQPYPTSPKK